MAVDARTASTAEPLRVLVAAGTVAPLEEEDERTGRVAQPKGPAAGPTGSRNMRKLASVIAASAILVGAVTGTASAKPNAHPHFVADGMSIVYDGSTAYLHYVVAGLGNGGYGYVKGHGKFPYSATCRKRNGSYFTNTVDRLGVVNEHDVFGDRNGNYVANDALHPSSICPAGSTFGSLDSWSWTSVAIDLMSGPNGKIYESWTY